MVKEGASNEELEIVDRLSRVFSIWRNRYEASQELIYRWIVERELRNYQEQPRKQAKLSRFLRSDAARTAILGKWVEELQKFNLSHESVSQIGCRELYCFSEEHQVAQVNA
jgi:hypothetical protein